MKNHNIKTTLSPELVREFEHFYNATQESNMARRLRDMLVEYSKTDSAREDEWTEKLYADMYHYFLLLDKCEDEYGKEKRG